MLRYSFLCMIISYVRLLALSVAFCPCIQAHIFACLACLSKSSALSKVGHLWALTFTPLIVMTFEFCQRGATVDTPFLTVLKAWTSSFEHAMIIHTCVCFEFRKVLAARLALESLNFSVLSGFAPRACGCVPEGKGWPVDQVSCPPATLIFNRPNVMAGRPV